MMIDAARYMMRQRPASFIERTIYIFISDMQRHAAPLRPRTRHFMPYVEGKC